MWKKYTKVSNAAGTCTICDDYGMHDANVCQWTRI